MKNYTNKHGYYLSIISLLILSLFAENYFSFIFIGYFIVTLIFALVISSDISFFVGFKKFGKVLGITSLIISFLIFFKPSENNSEIEIIKKTEQDDLNTIVSDLRKNINELNNKIISDERNEIINNLVISNEFALSDEKEVLKKLDNFHEFHNWIKKQNDSIFSEFDNRLSEYRKNVTDEDEIKNIKKIITEMEMPKMMYFKNYTETKNIILEMKDLIKLKSECNYKISNGKIILFDDKCFKEWNKRESKLIENLRKYYDNNKLMKN